MDRQFARRRNLSCAMRYDAFGEEKAGQRCLLKARISDTTIS